MTKTEQVEYLKKALIRKGAIQEEGEADLLFAKRIVDVEMARIAQSFLGIGYPITLTPEQTSVIKQDLVKKLINEQLIIETPQVEVDEL